MVDLTKLDKMLDRVLASETAESLNHWIDEQMALDRSESSMRDTEFGILHTYDKYAIDSPLDKATLDLGVKESVSYGKVVISDSYDLSSFDTINLAS